jgi:hypothetical protein
MKVEAKGEVKAEVQVQDRIEPLIVGARSFLNLDLNLIFN